ncbi:unnamed protein product [Pseudo-nitzschia multistriata]|uniref:DUF647 domain-containing protein n=1 Tax=Pseudo-nitzschia multistriata TaxID=183589 RepID=A0A448ZHR3_9STRA|nr:unnamed protein product [Pseudo-nitzschia multistriata]
MGQNVFFVGTERLIQLVLLLFHVASVSAFLLGSQTAGLSVSGGRSRKKLQRPQYHFLTPAAESDSRFQDIKNRTNCYLLPPISDRNIELQTTQALVYDHEKDSFVRASSSQGLAALYSVDSSSEKFSIRIQRGIKLTFLPEGVNKSYYHFIRWRFLQRFINSNLHVLGTQSLIMGLGIKSAKTLGVSAALTWVLKDALGKLTRLLWASRMGRRFDSDAKRWRFRASLVYALGNYMEILTYINPSLFLLWATIANSCKQVAMLTSSATRTSLYNSFRDGKRENIADITAKGEAQIATVDLIGIAFGVSLSRFIGTSVKNVMSTYFMLQILEIFCLYRQIRGVEYKVMNFERMTKVVGSFLDVVDDTDCTTAKSNTNSTVTEKKKNPDILIPSPSEIARNERIFLPPKHLRRRTLAFGSLGRTKLNPEELSKLLELFANERYILVVGENTKNPQKRHKILQKDREEEKVQQSCHIVLHEKASNLDIVKSTLAILTLRRKLLAQHRVNRNTESLRSSDCWAILEEVRSSTDRLFPLLLKQLSLQGWASPSRSMFGRVSWRASWPLQREPTRSSRKL